jgi:hypothetical protein
MKTVYVVTGPQLGWDCVVAVYTESVTLKTIKEEYPEPEYIISKMTLETEFTKF